MKDRIILLTLIVALGLKSSAPVLAQAFATVHNFSGTDGSTPETELILSNDTLYGTTLYGGPAGRGTVFKVNTDGSGFTNLHFFTDISNSPPYGNSDGAQSFGALILLGDALYGTTQSGGNQGTGTIFKVSTDAMGFATVYNFTGYVDTYPYPNSDGASPEAGLIFSTNALFGICGGGGSLGNGSVFTVNTNGMDFTNLESFAAFSSDEAYPEGALVLSGNTLYGAVPGGGNQGNGMVFAVNTAGTGFTNLHNFTAVSGNLGTGTNGDGAAPYGGVILSGNTLYGTARYGGNQGVGVVFAINTDGTGFTNLHDFTATAGFPYYTNTDGAYPVAGLFLSGNTLYGTAEYGGNPGWGVVFAVKTDGSGFTNLYNFTALNGNMNNDGAYPAAGLILSQNTLYGAAKVGGSGTYGTIFSLSFAPQLAIAAAGTNVILTWPTNVAGFDYSGFALQSATNLHSTNWSAVSPPPVVVNGQYTVINIISGAQTFYRLIQ